MTSQPISADVIYKICDKDLWAKAVDSGSFEGAEIDIKDGFIHFSTREQSASTLALHFAGRDNLLLIAVDAKALGDKVVYEEARGGTLFPHLYDVLDMKYVLAAKPLALDKNGKHIIPDFTSDIEERK